MTSSPPTPAHREEELVALSAGAAGVHDHVDDVAGGGEVLGPAQAPGVLHLLVSGAAVHVHHHRVPRPGLHAGRGQDPHRRREPPARDGDRGVDNPGQELGGQLVLQLRVVLEHVDQCVVTRPPQHGLRYSLDISLDTLATRVPCHLAEARVHVVAGAGVHAHAAPCALLAARGHQLACHTSEVDIFILILENGSSYLPDVPALGRHCVEVEAAGPPRRGAEQVDEPRVVLTNERRGNRVWTNERSPGPRRGSS